MSALADGDVQEDLPSAFRPVRRPSRVEMADSPTPSSTASESPAPAVTDGVDCVNGSGDEHCQLLGAEEESSDRGTSDDNDDGGGDDGVWSITKEQLNYYTTQFFQMQPSPSGIIPGAQAKEFFEKSRLPISELRMIWQLSDVGKDGGLSLEEFLTAMHLVVLRRNEISLPESLPRCLRPGLLRKKLEGRINGDEESPRPKPVNFDFSDVRRDPSIVQPVALRVSPDVGQSSDLEETEDEARRAEQMLRPSGQKQGRGEVVYEQLWNRRDDEDDEDLSAGPASLQSLRRPHLGHPAPPPPPPRTGKNPASSGHARSSSLDLNRCQQQGVLGSKPPPAIPPRYHSPANSTQDEETEDTRSPSPRGPTSHEAFAVFHSRQMPISHSVKMSDLSKDARTLQIGIHEFRERNSVIARTINELHQEVSDILEERIALEYQLEQLKSFGE